MYSFLIFIFLQLYSFLILFVPLLIVMAFITLLERKVMGIMQRRRGPNVIGFFGLLQPFADGVKLLLKEPVFPYQSDILLFIFAPLLTFFVSLLSWVIIPLTIVEPVLDLNIGVIFILGSSSLGVYGILLAGWASNSKYAFFGSIRSAAQMISYEVAMSLAIFPVICLSQSFSLKDIILVQTNSVWFLFSLFPSAICFYISILAETNRSPFDLPEAEGELVAGYNVEYSAFFFAFFLFGRIFKYFITFYRFCYFIFRWRFFFIFKKFYSNFCIKNFFYCLYYSLGKSNFTTLPL